MGVRILHDRDGNMAALYCSTSGFAFGPTFHDGYNLNDHDAAERAEAFCRWLENCPKWYEYDRYPTMGDRRRDPRQLTDAGMERAYSDWLSQEDDQWQREADAEAAKYAD